ncbi:stage III sporulation protein SpoIIIAB [Alkalihalobacillus trypoxylicola]|uniref:Stage III sporulation protein SpoAB n=1 Tax=Alkalihalobacillus trypoxylicola TaxID=519424 RepID=A0A161PDL4_9BACI|nr:stage III sporulation protein SpoIIIAB [Alkalihalobacillus trypoxylicola]KYG30962.1 stage III sporulation protein SpoAB [Alkalihalobacillus trypoxylicola]
MKLLGAICILITATLIGFEYARKLSERPKQLRLLMSAMQSFEAEMLFGLTPLAEASQKIAKQIPKPLSHFFEAFSSQLYDKQDTAYKAWERSLEETWGETALLETEKEIMRQFGSTLGQQDHEQQTKQMKLTLMHLEREELEARDKQRKYEKMFKSLGFLSGLLMVVILI